MKNSVEHQFLEDLLKCARAVNIPLNRRAVTPSLRVENAKRQSVTMCFRVRIGRKAQLPQIAALAGFQRAYLVNHEGRDLRVTCVLSGPTIRAKAVTWEGEPASAIG